VCRAEARARGARKDKTGLKRQSFHCVQQLDRKAEMAFKGERSTE
jgi:hypothetical protein